jgi:hypothetical protein
MPMSRHDAELFWDKAIPKGAVDDSLPSRCKRANAVRLVNVQLKPAAVIERMARKIERLMASGTVTESQLRLMGFSDTDLAAYGSQAMATASRRNPSYDSLEQSA